MNPIVLFIIGAVVLVGLYFYSRKKKGKSLGLNIPNPFSKEVSSPPEEGEPEREPEQEIYIMLKYNMVQGDKKNKQPPPLLWPNPFGSVREIEAWRDANPKLMEGVSEIAEAPRR